MSLRPLGAGSAYQCQQCAAVLLSPEHAAMVRRGADKVAARMAEQGTEKLGYVRQELDKAPLHCPICRVVMQAEWTPKRIRLDHCQTHGTFFDVHELMAMTSDTSDTWAIRPGKYEGNAGDAVLTVIATLLGGGD